VLTEREHRSPLPARDVARSLFDAEACVRSRRDRKKVKKVEMQVAHSSAGFLVGCLAGLRRRPSDTLRSAQFFVDCRLSSGQLAIPATAGICEISFKTAHWRLGMLLAFAAYYDRKIS
jgi:hypothetical protein